MARQDFAIRDLIPTTGIFPSYILSACRLCDAPTLYHLGSMLAVLAACVSPHAIGVSGHAGRQKKEPLFLWILLLGESGARKTEAMKKALAVATVDRDNLECGAGPLASRTRSALGSRAGLVEMLRVEPDPFVVIEEVPTWIKSNRAAYMHDGAATWCEIFDGRILDSNLVDNVKKNATRGIQPEIRVSLIGTGATPKVLRATREDDWTGGLFARVMLLSTDPPRDRPGPYSWGIKALMDTRKALQDVIREVRKTGQIRVSDQARQLWDGWLLDLGRRTRPIYTAHSIILRRLPSFAFRIACLYAISRGSLVAEIGDMDRALRLAEVSVDSVMELDLS